ncbi:MAG TPA: DUF302 domain-containing protein [Steroidobacteraceae bacterium]|jgi:uncharacterized protein (DUF302 family)|nr:DUF302 domain-containing protein [Steroidobacteraceae bacterium]
MAISGLIAVQSSFGARETLDRFEAAIKARGMTVFARIDHAAGASAVGLTLRPTDLLIFGNPKTGTALMLAAQTSGIDLPLKALAYQDDAGTTWLAYNDPKWIADRHGLSVPAAAAAEPMAAALSALVKQATQADA